MLLRGSTAVGAAALVGTAGCTGQLPSSADSKPPEYAQWMPAFLDGVSPPVRFTAEDYSSFAANEDELAEDLLERLDELEHHWEPASISWRDVTMALKFRSVVVVRAEFERDEVIADYEAENFDDETEHEDFTVMLGPDEKAAAGVGDDTLVTWWGSGSIDVVTDIIDAGNGNGERYSDASGDFDELADTLGDGTYVNGQTTEKTATDDPEDGHFENLVARGESWRIDGSTTDGRWVLVFEAEDDVETDDLRNWFESREHNDGWSVFGEWKNPRYSQSGRAGIVEASIDTSDL